MNWLDLTALAVWIIFLAVGARLGNLWMGACLIGGFLGAFLADTYALPLATALGHFAGVEPLAWLILFVVGLLCAFIPCVLLSKINSALFLGLTDSLLGLLTGAVTGFVVVSFLLLLLVPVMPAVEKSKAWKKSAVVRPLQRSLEDLFSDIQLHPAGVLSELKTDTARALQPVAKTAKEKVKDLTEKIADRAKK